MEQFQCIKRAMWITGTVPFIPSSNVFKQDLLLNVTGATFSIFLFQIAARPVHPQKVCVPVAELEDFTAHYSMEGWRESKMQEMARL